jgi:branched-chain amino acid transport system permease protein
VIVDLALGTLVLASVFAITNVGFVILYKGTGVPNFAQGALLMLGAYVMSDAWLAQHGYWVGLLVAAAILAAVGVVVYFLVMRVLLGHAEFEKAILTFLLASVITSVVGIRWGEENQSLPSVSHRRYALWGGNVALSDLVGVGVVAVIVIVTTVYMAKTVQGLRMRAQAENEMLAVYRGIHVHRISAGAWALACACAAVAGITYGEVSSVNLNLSSIGLVAFPAAIIGGLDSVGGTIIGAIVVAATGTLGQYYLNGQWSTVFEYAVMLVIIVFLPTGLFGSKQLSRL